MYGFTTVMQYDERVLEIIRAFICVGVDPSHHGIIEELHTPGFEERRRQEIDDGTVSICTGTETDGGSDDGRDLHVENQGIIEENAGSDIGVPALRRVTRTTFDRLCKMGIPLKEAGFDIYADDRVILATAVQSYY